MDFVSSQSVNFERLRDQKLARNRDLFFFNVAAEFNQFQAVKQGRRQRIEIVGGSDEEHLRQIVRHVEVMVRESEVLFRVEDFQQRCGWIAAKVHAELVDLV